MSSPQTGQIVDRSHVCTGFSTSLDDGITLHPGAVFQRTGRCPVRRKKIRGVRTVDEGGVVVEYVWKRSWVPAAVVGAILAAVVVTYQPVQPAKAAQKLSFFAP